MSEESEPHTNGVNGGNSSEDEVSSFSDTIQMNSACLFRPTVFPLLSEMQNPQVCGLHAVGNFFFIKICVLQDDQKNMRPVDIEADVKEMERRKRVEAIMNSQVRRIGQNCVQ